MCIHIVNLMIVLSPLLSLKGGNKKRKSQLQLPCNAMQSCCYVISIYGILFSKVQCTIHSFIMNYIMKKDGIKVL